jgi:hypothetical protein
MQKSSLISMLKMAQGNNIPASDAQINLSAHVSCQANEIQLLVLREVSKL